MPPSRARCECGAPLVGWIGVDLDGTLAVYHSWRFDGSIGEPIPAMVAAVKAGLAQGWDMRIFTARVCDEERDQVALVQAWCSIVFGKILPVTNVKDYDCLEIWDDRACAIEANAGTFRNPSKYVRTA